MTLSQMNLASLMVFHFQKTITNLIFGILKMNVARVADEFNLCYA